MRNDQVNSLKKGKSRRRRPGRSAFTLLEVLTALAILGLVTSSVIMVINRCMGAAADSAIQMEAFNLAREKMETILASESVNENVEYGTSELYPDMSWRAVTEVFSEPLTGQMWIRAVCSAEYTDSKDEKQTVELVHWVAMLSDKQADLLGDAENLEALAAEQLIESIEFAAEYSGVDEATIEQWMENGLLTTDDGAFIQYNLDVFISTNGQPTDAEQAQQVASIDELVMVLSAEAGGTEAEDEATTSEEEDRGR